MNSRLNYIYVESLSLIQLARKNTAIPTGRPTQNKNVKKPGQVQITMNIISIAQRIIPIIVVYLSVR